MTIEEEIKEIRNQLRLRMNGVISTSMREKGIKYKLNFGVSFPDLREIASTHESSDALSRKLWEEDIREFKILSLLLQPLDKLSEAEAESRIEGIKYMEIAEVGSKFLFSKLPYASEMALRLIEKDKQTMQPVIGWLIISGWFQSGKSVKLADADYMLSRAMEICNNPTSQTWNESRSAVLAMKTFGAQSPENAKKVLERGAELERGNSIQKEIYNELKFEFEYSF